MKYIDLLGYRCRDIVTGFEGVAESVAYDLYGCIQVCLRPPYKQEKDEMPDGRWIDGQRLKVLEDTPVMKVPDFTSQSKGKKKKEAGPADLPSR